MNLISYLFLCECIGRGSYFVTRTKKKYQTDSVCINRETPEGDRWKLNNERVVYDEQKCSIGKETGSITE